MRCLYVSLLMLLGNDVLPQNTIQTWMVVIADFSGLVIQANLFGELAELVYELYLHDIELQRRIDASNAAIINLHLPEEVQSKAISYIRGVYSI